MSIEEQFDAAVKVIQSLPKDGFFQPSNEMRLRFYAFFKQATEGPNTTKKPAFYDIINRYKWDAWTKCGQMSRTEAMLLYVDELKKVIETISMTHEVSEFLDLLGPFYEFLPDDMTNGKTNNGSTSADTTTTTATTTTNTMTKKVNGENIGQNQIATTTIINNNHNHHVEQENFTITYDSDGDEFTDTIDSSFSPQHQQVPKIFCNTFNDDDHDDDSIINAHHHSNNNMNNQNMSSLVGEKNSSIINNRSESKTINQSSSSVAAAAAAPPNVLLDFNEQLAVAIFQLQNSLDRITNRVHKLEQQQQQQQQQVTIRQQQQQSSISGINDNNQNNNGWPFRELRPQTTLFILTWPMAVFFLLNYLQRIRKK
ncbi:Acyl-CoA binding domain containing 5 [Dermatophagoides farinae]|uniref:Acyl-CoA binding domain containing 5 n=1 Tax=Dermatophagoides farinae TaxID=6954 RepID=A0A922I125_DERFA|nr:Acyl-CoA binding domain containing 5 [Dermatophagoides farinae]